MAGERTLPGLGLVGGWNSGDNTFKVGMDTNLRTLSALVQPVVTSVLAAAPGSPVAGDMHLASSAWGGGAANDIMLYDEIIDEANTGTAAWIALTPQAGWGVFDQATGKELLFDGTNWIDPANPRIVVDTTTAYSLSDADLDGRTVIELSNGGAITFTLTAGLANLRPVTVINTGGGNIAFAEDTGVTRQSAHPNLKTQWGWATIIPKGSDVFHVGGNLEAA